MPNMTVAMMTLCDPSADLGVYLTVPQHLTLDLDQLRVDFCDVDLNALIVEFNRVFDVIAIMDEVFISTFYFLSHTKWNKITFIQKIIHIHKVKDMTILATYRT
jgi:hypothetical protein